MQASVLVHSDDPSALDMNRRGTHAVRQHDASAAEDRHQLRVARFRNDPDPLRPTNAPFSITSRPRDSTVSVAPVT